MTRRVLSPAGGACAFAAVFALVVGGLGWVTVAALGVETAKIRATARADAGNKERLALWQLDGRLFPTLGVENHRPYAHYFPLHIPTPVVFDGGPAADPVRVPSPLLSTELPNWMLLHFQIDPDAGWSSPQVIPADLEANLRGQPGNTLTLANVTPGRRLVLAEVRDKFPTEDVLATFADLDPPDTADSAGAVPVLVMSAPETGAGLGRRSAGERDIDGLRAKDSPVNSPAPGPAEAKSVPPPAPVTSNSFARNGSIPQQQPSTNPPFAGRPPGNKLTPEAKENLENYNARLGAGQRGVNDARGGNTAEGAAGGQAGGMALRFSPVDKAEVAGKSLGEVPFPPGGIGGGGFGSGLGGFGRGGPPPAAAVPPAPAGPAPGAAGRGAQLGDKLAEAEKKLTVPAPKAVTKADAAKEAEVLAKAGEKQLHRGEADSSANPADADGKAKKMDTGAFRKRTAIPQPPAVHLGTMRPLWLTAADGTETLVLVRAARLDGKTVYQGAVLDWPKLRETLVREVTPFFADADLVPVKDAAAATERTMTALPARLDPGPDPVPPAVGWTPLRLGLAAAWAAAVVALLAVGFGGRALIDLSERRIRFVSAVTHELRTPLTSLRLYLDLLTSGMIREEEQQREYLNTLHAESERLHRLIENVLDFSRLENRAARGKRVPVPLAQVLAAATDAWAGRCAADGKQLVVISTLPADQVVVTDAVLAGQVIGNLIDNARKYSRDAADPRVWLWAKPGDRKRIHVEVEDRGPGVAAADRAGMFRPFRRGRAADAAAGGAGLGLALATQWAAAAGGRVTYRPADGGVGACFRFTLPVK